MGSENVFSGRDFPVCIAYNQQLPKSHYHPEMELSLVLRGHGRYFVRDTAFDLRQGMGVIVHRDDVHYGIPDTDSSMLRAVAIFDLRLLSNCPAAEEALSVLSVRSHFTLMPSETTEVELLLREIDDELTTRRSAWQEVVRCDLERLLIFISRANSSELPARVSGEESDLVTRVVRHLEAAFAQRQSVEEIARAFGVSPQTLRRAFRKCAGIGVKEFVVRLRIIEAKRLLEHTDDKVATVAYEVGFDNLSAFNRDFRIVCGVSPSEYRRLARDYST